MYVSFYSLQKQKYYFANKGPSNQGYGFSSGHVWMWELDCEESWVPKNWCFGTAVLEKTLESPLDCKEIQPVHPKGDQPWVFIGSSERTNSIVKEVWVIKLIQSRGLRKDTESHKIKIKEVNWAQILQDLNIMAIKKLSFPSGASGKESTCWCRKHKRHGFDPYIGTISWRRKWQPTPVFLPGEFHRQRSLAGHRL